MKIFQRIVLGVMVITFIALLWKMHPSVIFHQISQVGWGILLILAQEIVAHGFNSLGWRCAFAPEDVDSYPLGELLRLRITGDGVNYLTPSGTVAGEFIRAVLLNDSRPPDVRYASVSVAKVSQAVAQVLFIFMGVLAVIGGAAPALVKYRNILLGIAATIVAVLSSFFVFSVWLWSRIKSGKRLETAKPWLSSLGSIPYLTLNYVRHHPCRFASSMTWFACGYAWGGFEAYWICRFLGTPVPVTIAMVIEVFSNLVDSLMFMVPAKIGTQELGKTAIFAALGLKPSAGFAFGLVRHFREVVWGGVGLILYSTYKKRALGVSEQLDPA